MRLIKKCDNKTQKEKPKLLNNTVKVDIPFLCIFN